MAGIGGIVFGSDEPTVVDASDGTIYSMGTTFQSDVPGKISQIHWRSPTGLPGSFSPAVLPIKAYLWHVATTTIVGSAEFDPLLQGEWEHETVDWDIEDHTNYIISIVTDRYTATSGYFFNGKDLGHISVPEQAGRFYDLGTGTFPIMPNSQYLAGGYFIDFDFVADDEVPDGPTIAVWNGTAEVAASMMVWNGTAEVAASIDSIV